MPTERDGTAVMPNEAGPVLIVDDDAAVRNALKFALEVEGLDVKLYDGAPALLADSALPARGCLVIDYAMPAMNGVELMDALRHRNVGLAAILITGRATSQLCDRARRAGFGQVIEKPLSDAALIEGIRAALADVPAT